MIAFLVVRFLPEFFVVHFYISFFFFSYLSFGDIFLNFECKRKRGKWEINIYGCDNDRLYIWNRAISLRNDSAAGPIQHEFCMVNWIRVKLARLSSRRGDDDQFGEREPRENSRDVHFFNRELDSFAPSIRNIPCSIELLNLSCFLGRDHPASCLACRASTGS